jgi:DNA-binding CsgD family transcriptional regulator
MLIPRRPVVVRLACEQLFANHIAFASSLGYGLVVYSATLPSEQAALFALVGPLAALWMFWAGIWLLKQQNKPQNRLGSVLGFLLGSSLGTGITYWLSGTEFGIALQGTGIAAGVASVVGLRFGARAATIAAALGGLCAASGASLLPTMLENNSWLAWVVCLAGSAWVTWWLGCGIAKTCALENPVALGNLWVRLQQSQHIWDSNPTNQLVLETGKTQLLEPSSKTNQKQVDQFLDIDTPKSTILKATPPEITKKQLEVLQLLSRGYTDKKMAIVLGISEAGVRRRIDNLRERVGAKNRNVLLIRAVQYGLIEEVADSPLSE